MPSLLDRLPTYTLGYPLGSTYKIILYFLIPPIFLFAIYFTLFAADVTLIYKHIIENNPRWSAVTFMCILSPAIACFIFTVASPSVWPKDKPLAKENMRFLGIQLWHLFGFPFAVMYRYVYRVFWAVEAMFANLRCDDIRREESISLLLEPNNLELYFFLQAYLHCAPQIILQFYIMLNAENSQKDTVSLQILSICTCLLRMAITTMSYQRFERRKVLGVRYPWTTHNTTITPRFSNMQTRDSTKSRSHVISNIVGLPLDGDLKTIDAKDESKLDNAENEDDEGFESPTTNMNEDSDEGSSPTNRNLSMMDRAYVNNVNQIEHIPQINKFEPAEHEPLMKRIHQTEQLSPSSFPRKTSWRRDTENSDVELDNDAELNLCSSSSVNNKQSDDEIENEENKARPKLRVSIVENQELEIRRKEGKKTYNIVDMSKHTTPPETPAPRPISFGVIKERIMNNAESILHKIPHRTYKKEQDIDLPIRVRQNAIKGIEQEDAISKFIAFLAWCLFLISRMLALMTFSYFYTAICIYISVSHYLLMVILLLWNSWSESLLRKMFYLFLGYIYIFCIIEFKMKFIKVRLWYGLYFVLVSSENFLMTAVWFWNGSWESWWFGFMGSGIVLSTFLSYMCFLMYFLTLKPRPLTVYPLISTQSCFPATIS